MSDNKMEICNKDECIRHDYMGTIHDFIEKIETKNKSQTFKMLSDPKRLEILYALHYSEELCVCNIAEITKNSVASVSHHLQLLKKLGIVSVRKEGKWVFYHLKDELIRELLRVTIKLH